MIKVSKAGRCANGFERGRGVIIHYLNATEKQIDSGAFWLKALCGTETGRRSVGWTQRPESEVTCKKCLKKASVSDDGLN